MLRLIIPRRLNRIVLYPLIMLCLQCTGRRGERSLPPEEWRLVPETTILGVRRQFFVYGWDLGDAVILVPPSVTVEKGALSPDARLLSIYLIVADVGSRPDSNSNKEQGTEDEREKRHKRYKKDDEGSGERTITVKTATTSTKFRLQVLDEKRAR